MTSFRQSNQSNRTSTQALQKTSKTRRNMGLALASLLFAVTSNSVDKYRLMPSVEYEANEFTTRPNLRHSPHK